MNIILVDDDLDDVLIFSQAIKDINNAVNCVELGSGRDLLNYLEVATYVPRLIFLDFNMPVMNGLECLAELRKRPRFESTPVVIYTIYLTPGQQSNCLAPGASVIYKPNTYSELLEVVESKIFEISTHQ